VKTSESFILVLKSAIVTPLRTVFVEGKGILLGKKKGEWREEEA
jgi:hypothetical protein